MTNHATAVNVLRSMDEDSAWMLFTAQQAERELGIPAGTVRAWASRKRLYSQGIDLDGRPMYTRKHLVELRDGKIET